MSVSDRTFALAATGTLPQRRLDSTMYAQPTAAASSLPLAPIHVPAFQGVVACRTQTVPLIILSQSILGSSKCEHGRVWSRAGFDRDESFYKGICGLANTPFEVSLTETIVQSGQMPVCSHWRPPTFGRLGPSLSGGP